MNVRIDAHFWPSATGDGREDGDAKVRNVLNSFAGQGRRGPEWEAGEQRRSANPEEQPTTVRAPDQQRDTQVHNQSKRTSSPLATRCRRSTRCAQPAADSRLASIVDGVDADDIWNGKVGPFGKTRKKTRVAKLG